MRLPIEYEAKALSFLCSSGKIPRGFQYPCDDPEHLRFLMKRTPSKLSFAVKPRLFASSSVKNLDLNRLSDFDVSLLDASSPRRVDCDISGVSMPHGADLRNVDLSGLHARGADFSKAAFHPEQLLQFSEISRIRIPANMPLEPINQNLIEIAEELPSIRLSSENIKNCDLSCTDYPFEKLFENNFFEGVTFPHNRWDPFSYDECGNIQDIVYTMVGCVFRRCDLSEIRGLTQGEANQASFYECALPPGITGQNYEIEEERGILAY